MKLKCTLNVGFSKFAAKFSNNNEIKSIKFKINVTIVTSNKKKCALDKRKRN